MTDRKHAPTPWRTSGLSAHDIVGPVGFGAGMVRLRHVASTHIQSTHPAVEDRCAANAAFIVRAVNAHDALVEALESILCLIDQDQAETIGEHDAEYIRAALELAGEGS